MIRKAKPGIDRTSGIEIREYSIHSPKRYLHLYLYTGTV
jgi:hypothetical protein